MSSNGTTAAASRVDVRALLDRAKIRTDAALARFLPPVSTFPKHLSEATRYSVFSGGKRVRPFLVLETAKLCGQSESAAMPLACAVEMIHAYSLVHDDLPAMDDDDFRRGRKTCHKQFDEATAILAGDGLMSLAFEVLADKAPDAKRFRETVKLIARAIGPHGMVGGQAADLKFQEKSGNEQFLTQVNRMKTGALITACTEAGAVWAGSSAVARKSLREYGQSIGFLFQLVDDIIDADGFASLWGKEETYRVAARVRDKAMKALSPFGARGRVLTTFAEFLYERKE